MEGYRKGVWYQPTETEEVQRPVQRVWIAGGGYPLFGEEEPDKLNASNKYLWGKNFLSNSDIKFEYYDSSVLNSYPDFIMIDSFDRVHIFEVKSVNIALNMPAAFNQEDYINKIGNLKKCYKQASIVTKQIFYLPILNNETWQITQFENGNERLLTREQFIHYVLNKD